MAEEHEARWGWLAAVLVALAIFAALSLFSMHEVVDRHAVWWSSSTSFIALGVVSLAATVRVLSLRRFTALEAACVVACIGLVLLIGHATAALALDPLAGDETRPGVWLSIHGCMAAPTAAGGRLWSLTIATVLAGACAVGLLPARRPAQAIAYAAWAVVPMIATAWLGLELFHRPMVLAPPLVLVLVVFVLSGRTAGRSFRSRMARLLAALSFGLAGISSGMERISRIRGGGQMGDPDPYSRAAELFAAIAAPLTTLAGLTLLLVLVAMFLPRPRFRWLRDADAAWLPLMTTGVALAAIGHFHAEGQTFVNAIARAWDMGWHASYDGSPEIGKGDPTEATALPLVAGHALPTRRVTVDARGHITIEGDGPDVLVRMSPGATAQTVAVAIAKVRRPGDRFALAGH